VGFDVGALGMDVTVLSHPLPWCHPQDLYLGLGLRVYPQDDTKGALGVNDGTKGGGGTMVIVM
jgi:hypothetical protein